GVDLSSQSGLAFDGDGNLWVSVCDQIVRYKAADLATTGSPTPDIQISNSACSHALAFAPDGRLAAAVDLGGVAIFSPAQIAASGSPQPIVVADDTVGEAYGVAFDRSGNLWVADYNGGQVLRYSPDQLLVTGSPTPAATWSAPGGPVAFAFDADGNL